MYYVLWKTVYLLTKVHNSTLYKKQNKIKNITKHVSKHCSREQRKKEIQEL
jgi:hypothetical protein